MAVRNRIKYCLLVLFLSLSLIHQGQNSSVLSSGQWVKLGVTSRGVYKIDFETMRQAGFDPAGLAPENIQLYGQGGGMLPQSNVMPRADDLLENALYTVGLADNSFDRDDYILFFSEGPDLEYVDSQGHLVFEKNLYADTAYYFLTVGTQLGKRMEEAADLGGNHPEVTSYVGYRHQEHDLENILSSGRAWFGPLVTSTSQVRINFSDIPPLLAGSDIEVIGGVVNRGQEQATFNINLNGSNIGSIEVGGVGSGTYDDKGVVAVDTLMTGAGQISAQGSFEVEVSYQGGGNGLLDFLLITFVSPLTANNPVTYFRSPSSLGNLISTYKISGISPGSVIWDITDPQTAVIQQYNTMGEQALFSTSSQSLKEFAVISGNDFPLPISLETVENQDLRGLEVPELLIVAHPSFLQEAERLAMFREQNDQLEVSVVTPEEIYNEFSSGRQDVVAIRDFVRYLYLKNQKLKYLLLFGRSSFDYKNITEDNTNFVPTYQSRNSVDPIYSYNSDDFFGFLDDDEGIWNEDLNGSGGHLLNIGVGRLPVTSAAEAKGVVDKLIHYSTSQSSKGSWRQNIYYVADDGDFNLHQRDADQLATKVDTANQDFNVSKIYMDAFPQQQTPNGESAEAVRKAIEDAIKKGALIINYTGHGSEFRWADETILNHNMINAWENLDRLPLFVTATCEFGRNDDPKRVSGAEKLITNAKGGAIALVTTTRPVFASKNFILNRAFYEVALDLTEQGYPRLGDIFKYVKNDSHTIVANRNFALLGDPSMRLAYPSQQLTISEIISNNRVGDTIQALSPVKITGVVVDPEGLPLTNYQGIAEVSVFDKQTTTETLGSDGGRTFSFLERNSIIFRGQASITNGKFEVNFVVPKNINYQNGFGKISLYALSTNGLSDAGGASSSFVIGGSNKNAPSDNTPPLITLYMDDTSFVDGGSTGENTLFLARLSDENGINISSSGFGQDISALLDSEDEFILNDFYTADVDSYQSGWVRYPMDHLKNGPHTITLKVWDTYNNSSETSLEFYVFEGSRLALSQVMNYPNPFTDATTFLIDHNQPGTTLEVEIRIFDRMGRLIDKILTKYENSPSTINNISWDGNQGGGLRLESGIYLYQVIVKSAASNDKKVENQKMILIK